MSTVSSLNASNIPQSMKINIPSSIYPTTQTEQTSATPTSTTEATISTQWGFKVDEDGYFGADFNAAAGIPSHVKIHEKTLEMVAKSMQVMGSSQDPISALSKAWSNFSKIAGNSLDPDGSMNLSQIHNMPVSYVIDSSIFGNVVSVQQTDEQDLKVQEAAGEIVTLSNSNFSAGNLPFFGMNKDVNRFSDYKDMLSEIGITTDKGNANEDEISVGNLFSYFVGLFAPKTEGDVGYVKAVQSYFEFTQSGQSIEDYAKSNFGEDFLNEVLKGYGMTADKKFSQELVDLLLKEVNAYIQQNAQSYKAILESQKTSSLASNSSAKSYLSLNDTTLQSGSLISIKS